MIMSNIFDFVHADIELNQLQAQFVDMQFQAQFNSLDPSRSEFLSDSLEKI